MIYITYTMALTNQSIKQRTISRYQSAINVHKAEGKLLNNYKQTRTTAEYVALLGSKLGRPGDSLVDICQSNTSNTRSAYVHPQVATHLAMWMSPGFTIDITQWIEEWKSYSKDNRDRYERAIDGLEISSYDKARATIRAAIAREYNGRTEVGCPSGIADIATHEYVIEVAPITDWKQAMGLAQVYGLDMCLKPAVYLFTLNEHNAPVMPREADLKRVRSHFKCLGVILLNDLQKPSPFNVLSKEALLALVMHILTVDIRCVRGLAVNKRIWGLTNAIWPAIARSQLHASPRHMHAEELIKILLATPNAYSTRTLTLCTNALKRHVFTIEVNDDELKIILCGFVASFTRRGWKFRLISVEQITNERSILGIQIMRKTDSCTARACCRIAKSLVSRILPEMIDTIDL